MIHWLLPEIVLRGVKYKMPTMCKNGNCRRPAVYGFNPGKPLYCSEHRLPDTYNTKLIKSGTKDSLSKSGTEDSLSKSGNCGHKPASTRYKGYCTSCYVAAFPDDPLSLQTLYKSKTTVMQKFIDTKFDGFVHHPDFSSIQINGKTVCIGLDESKIPLLGNHYIIKFSPSKYTQLYTQLPKLEQQIADQIENLCSF